MCKARNTLITVLLVAILLMCYAPASYGALLILNDLTANPGFFDAARYPNFTTAYTWDGNKYNWYCYEIRFKVSRYWVDYHRRTIQVWGDGQKLYDWTGYIGDGKIVHLTDLMVSNIQIKVATYDRDTTKLDYVTIKRGAFVADTFAVSAKMKPGIPWDGTFESSSGWSSNPGSGSIEFLKNDGIVGPGFVRITDSANHDWKAVYGNPALSLNPGKWYRVSVYARSSANRGTSAYGFYSGDSRLRIRLNWPVGSLGSDKGWVRQYAVFQCPFDYDPANTGRPYLYGQSHHNNTVSEVDYDGYLLEEFDTLEQATNTAMFTALNTEKRVTEAKNMAKEARDKANTAATNAANAKSSADAAKSSADTAAARTIYAGHSAAQWAHWANNNADEAKWNTAFIRNTQLPALETKINNLETTVNNIQSSIGPQIQKISGQNGATCTTGTTFNVVIQASGATEFRVKADTGSWSDWISVGSTATASGISGSGAHTIYVEARNTAGNITTGQITIFKI